MRDPHKPTRRYLPLGEPKVRCQRGQPREAQALGPGVARQPRPQELGSVGNQAAGEQTVGDENAGVEDPARDENLADLGSAGRLALDVRWISGYTSGVSVEQWRLHAVNLSETRCYE